jgi:signal transduction histidine kinase
MSHAAEQIGARDFSRRIPVSGEDEFAELANTLNGLLGRLETTLEQQKRLIEQQRRFTADASHELKTPLTVIKGNAGMALSGRLTEDGMRQSIADIDQAAESMSRLVRDLLLLARSDAGQLGQNRIEVLVREVLERAISTTARPGAATIRLHVADESLSVVANENELVRVFLNLLANAVRHTPPDGCITVSARRDEDRAIISVADTGAGIAPEHLPHLGERFYRADSARARQDGGTGLGLSICKGILETHGGEMVFESVAGKGTTVTVALPAA